MSKNIINVGIIGLQGYGGSYFHTFARRNDVRVLGICDTLPEALAAKKAEYNVPFAGTDYRELLAQPIDAVFIATPHFLHHRMTMDALQAGKHVLCEKPLALTWQHAEEMARTARSVGKLLGCHYNQRVNFPTLVICEALAKGLLGEVYQFNAAWMARHTSFMFDPVTTWRQSREKSGGGILIGRGSHLIDAVLYMLGHPPVQSVYATVTNRLTGYEVEDLAMATIRLAGGCTVQIDCSYVAHHAAYKERFGYEVLGTRGGLFFEKTDGVEVCRCGGCHLPSSEWISYEDQIDLDAIRRRNVQSVVDDFLDAIQQERDPLVTGEQAANVTRILEAAYESAREGKVITL